MLGTGLMQYSMDFICRRRSKQLLSAASSNQNPAAWTTSFHATLLHIEAHSDVLMINAEVRHQSSGALSTKSQTPHGQAPAQNPQPMHRSSSTTYSYAPSSSPFLLMACCGQTDTQIPQSRQAPQDEHWDPQ
jgi:hypothetical protein